MRNQILKILLSSVFMLIVVSAVSAQQPLKRYEYIKHKAAAGESISSILKIYNIPLTVVAVDNPAIMEKDYVLSQGSELFIRKSSIGAATAKEIDQQIKLYNKERSAGQPPVTQTAVTVASPNVVYTKTDLLDANTLTHFVEPHETLYSISKKYDVSMDDIRTLNPEIAEGGLKAGSTIIIKIIHPDDRRLVGKPEKHENTFIKRKREDYLSVAVFLPLSEVSSAEKQSFTALYKGALVALDSLKRDGLNVHVDLYDTKKNATVVDSIVRSGVLNDVDLIIGPVYNDQFSMAARYAQRKNIPIVSPLIEVSASDGVVVQMTPYLPNRYEKLEDLLMGTKVVYFNSPSDDREFMRKVSSSLRGSTAKEVSTIQYNKFLKPQDLVPYLDTRGETVFVVSATNVLDAEMILSKITALSNSYPARYITVLASPAFAKFEDVKKSEFFKVETRYVTSYHSDRIDEKSYNFEKEYIRFFNERPTMMSYRGYDMMMIFLSAMREAGSDNVLQYLDEKSFAPLQVKYSFFRPVEGGKLVNEEWPLVIYKTDKTIEIK